MNAALAPDRYTAEAIQALAPHKGMVSLTKLRALTDAAAHPKPVVCTVANYLSYPDDPLTAEDDAYLRELSML